VEKFFTSPQDWLQVESVRGYRTDDPQKELYRYISQRIAGVATLENAMNRCGTRDCPGLPDKDTAHVDAAMEMIARMQGDRLHALPDVALVKVTREAPERDLAYTLIRNKAYKNVPSFLADERERDRADINQDTMTVVPWMEGSYPNFFFSVALSDIGDFTRRCAAIRNNGDYEKFVDRYGVRRTDPAFWAMADWFHDEYARNKPVLSGLFDLNRYQNR